MCTLKNIAGQAGASSSDNLTSYRFSYQTLSDQILPVTPNVRSLLGFELESVSLPKLRFLRVLCIEDSTLKDFSSVIGGCIHLRPLTLITDEDVMIPSSIRNLLYLQSINLPSLDVSSSLWDIPTLRYVYVKRISLPRNVQIPQNLP